jgi:hypothetical protein
MKIQLGDAGAPTRCMLVLQGGEKHMVTKEEIPLFMRDVFWLPSYGEIGIQKNIEDCIMKFKKCIYMISTYLQSFDR